MPRTILLSFLCLTLSGGAQALDRLSAAGAMLGSAAGGLAGGAIERSVDLDGDQPVISFALARLAGGGGMLQRTPSGGWTAWDGDPASLADSRFALGVGTLTYKLESSPSGAETLILGYRTPDGVKFGVLGLGGRP